MTTHRCEIPRDSWRFLVLIDQLLLGLHMQKSFAGAGGWEGVSQYQEFGCGQREFSIVGFLAPRAFGETRKLYIPNATC